MSRRPGPRSGADIAQLHVRVPVSEVQGTLALDLAPLLDPPIPPARPGRPACDLVAVETLERLRVQRLVNGYLQAVIEVIAGDRPAAQLHRMTRRDVHQDLVRRAELVARAGDHVAGEGRRRGLARSQVISVRLSFLDHDKVEVSAHVRHGSRSRAVAAQFVTFRGRWLCSALEFN